MWHRSLSESRLASFKFKLVIYFLLLALLPLTALFWGLTGVASQSETRLVDARLQADLRATLGAYRQSLEAAARSARALAANRSFQIALAHKDRRALQRKLIGSPELRVEAFAQEARLAGVAATSIGTFIADASAPKFLDAQGREMALRRLSYSHF